MASLSTPLALYKGERLQTVESAPALVYFERGTKPEKPLVVFIPGASHLARIAYGGHQGCSSSDFLGHWFQKSGSGHSFLALSYPLECTPPVMPATRPDFTVGEWGAQAAEATRLTIEEQQLPTRSVVLLMWSMGGKILQPYTQEARKRGLDVELAISLAATPALRGLREPVPNVTASAAGYAFAPGMQRSFLTQLHEQNSINSTKSDYDGNGDDGSSSGGSERKIIPDAVYTSEYIGNFPITMGTYGLRWTKTEGKLTPDATAGFEVADEMGLWELPYMGAIYGDSPLDFRHSTADHATWSFLMTYQLMGVVKDMIEKDPKINNPSSTNKQDTKNKPLQGATQLIHDTTAQMCGVVKGGTHHFFVGEKGARQTVEWIVLLQERLAEFKRKLSACVGVYE